MNMQKEEEKRNMYEKMDTDKSHGDIFVLGAAHMDFRYFNQKHTSGHGKKSFQCLKFDRSSKMMKTGNITVLTWYLFCLDVR